MGVSFWLRGRYEQPTPSTDDPVAEWLAQVENFFDGEVANHEQWQDFYIPVRRGTTYDGSPAVFAPIHPAGERVEFAVPEPGHIVVSGKTSTVGPGYHMALCDLIQWFGEVFKVSWNPPGEEDDSSSDETGYFFEQDQVAVEETMLKDLKLIARLTLEMTEGGEMTHAAWGMPIDYDEPEHPGDLWTVMGPRSFDWVRGVLEDPRNGIDVYPWWEPGPSTNFRVGRALHRMWCEVRWRKILQDDEYDDWSEIHMDLCHAFHADPTLDYPWREWAHLIDVLNEEDAATMPFEDVTEEVKRRAAEVPEDKPLIGYRRYPVRVSLPDGWSVRIPGVMAESWDDLTWSAWDGERTVWFKNWGLRTKDDEPVPAQDALNAITQDEGTVIHHQQDDLIGKAIVQEVEEDGETLINLNAFSAVDGKIALCNVFYHDPSDYDWAIETWHSMTTEPDDDSD